MESTAKTKWAIDATHSEISFRVKHLMISNVKGNFNDFSAEIFTSDNSVATSDVKVVINAASVDTANADRDGHLKSPDFFDVENHKEIIFTGKSVQTIDNENYKLTGNLTIKGISREITLDIEFGGLMKDPWGNEKAGFTVNGKINRRDWGLNWNAALEAGGVMVSDEVKISAEIELVKQK
jgi:polyisoprenoid-binding protein YceI